MKANITHTEWEKQYMYTLLSSPYAFEAFRYQQKNIKHFDQFTSRLIPCAKQIKQDYTIAFNPSLNKTIKDHIKYPLSELTKEYSCLNPKEVIDTFKTFLTDFINTYIQCDVITPFKIITNTNRYKKYQNIGIEFEYDYKGGIKWQDYKKYKDIISYDDDYDGNVPTRINETRLRLNGNKGFIGLYDYLNYIKKYNINPVSIHIHIDCDYDNTFDRLYNLYSIKSLINAIHNNEYYCMTILRTIFFTDTKYQYSNVDIYDIMYNNIYLNGQRTIEYRFCYPTYNYTSIITQILVLSLITYAIKHKTKINIKLLDLIYVTYLKLISTK